MESEHTITVCMGSSCFSRGNSRNIEVIQGYLASHGLAVDLRGHLCENRCKTGPNIVIDGSLYAEVHPVMLQTLLRRHLSGDEGERR